MGGQKRSWLISCRRTSHAPPLSLLAASDVLDTSSRHFLATFSMSGTFPCRRAARSRSSRSTGGASRSAPDASQTCPRTRLATASPRTRLGATSLRVVGASWAWIRTCSWPATVASSPRRTWPRRATCTEAAAAAEAAEAAAEEEGAEEGEEAVAEGGEEAVAGVRLRRPWAH